MAENLSSRGLLNSGFAGTYADANTSARGNDVNKALGDIVNTNTEYTDKLASLFLVEKINLTVHLLIL